MKARKLLPLAFGLLAVLAIAIVIMEVINLKKPASPSEIAAYVNNEAITMKELDYSYQYSLPLEYQEIMTKWQFLNSSIIPQKLLLQEAIKSNVTVSNEEVQRAISELVELSGISREEFEEQLEELNLGWADVELTYWTRLTIGKFIDGAIFKGVNVTKTELQRAYDRDKEAFMEENISMEEATPYLRQELLSEKQSAALLEYLETIRNNATIVILLDEAKEGIVSFSQSGEVCNFNGTIPIFMFTTSTCKECRIVASRLTALLQSYESKGDSPFAPYIWELDTGDNLYTAEVEQGVPKAHIAIFKGLSSQGEVPAYSFGCAYTRVGHLPNSAGNVNAEEEEFTSVLSALVVQNE